MNDKILNPTILVENYDDGDWMATLSGEVMNCGICGGGDNRLVVPFTADSKDEAISKCRKAISERGDALRYYRKTGNKIERVAWSTIPVVVLHSTPTRGRI